VERIKLNSCEVVIKHSKIGRGEHYPSGHHDEQESPTPDSKLKAILKFLLLDLLSYAV
jgi:hypothetical protein